MFDAIDTLIELVVVIAAVVSAWVVTGQVRRRVKASLGKTPTDLELASLKTWMKVDEREQQEKESGPVHPK